MYIYDLQLVLRIYNVSGQMDITSIMGSALICNVNKQKQLEWARNNLAEADSGFMDVIWTDESSIQLGTHRRLYMSI